MSFEPLVIAHRGASGHRPEHGADAYRLAIELGADAIEPDIVATRDGVLVLRHENEISGTTDVAAHPEFADRRARKVIDGQTLDGWFTEDFTWAELSTLRIRERLPELRPASATHDGEGGIQRLSDLLTLLDGDAATQQGVSLIAEIKHATYFQSIGLPLDELFTAELAAAGWSDDPRLTVESFERGVIDQLRARSLEARYVYLVEASGAAPDLVARDGSTAVDYATQLEPDNLAILADGLDGISVPKKMLLTKAGAKDPALVIRAHTLGLEIFTWTLRPENAFLTKALRGQGTRAELGDWRTEFEQIIATGVDGIFTDFPDLALEVLDRSSSNA